MKNKSIVRFWERIRPKVNKRDKHRNVKIFGYYALYLFIIILFFTALSFAWFAKDLPTPAKIANRKATESTKLFDRTGQTLLYETGEQKRTVIQSDQISNYLKDATVAVEDANFYRHRGYDSRAIASAVSQRLLGKTSRTRGASTITQQFVKNALLTSDRSMTRKFKELILSVELEFMYDKDEILTMYLNEIPYGNSTAGAEAASKMYFGKSAKDLTLAEATTLAAIPQAPTYYSPYGTHTKELIDRKNYVLDRMVETGKVKQEEAEQAKVEDTTQLGTTLKPRHDSMLAPHFAMYVLENVAEEYGEQKIQNEGLKIITTLDLDKQRFAEEAIAANEKKLAQNNAENAALVAIDPKTGQVLAMVGSRDYFNTEIDGNVNVTDSLRQPGSSFKPITYATAFKRNDFSPSRTLFDLQTDFGGGYVPKNYNGNFNGPVSTRTALGNSLNIPAVKALGLVGIDNVIKTAEDLGITSLNQRSRYGLSFALGVAEIKPVEMAGAFSTFANSGERHDIKNVIKISDSKGKVLYEYNAEKEPGKKVLDPQIAYEISHVLKDNNARSMVFGTNSILHFPNREVAVKTGTTQENKDSWTIGYTPSIATAVWAGNNTPSPMKAGGSMLAGPIFHQFMEKSLSGTPAEQFARPDGIKEVTVDRLSNRLPNEGSTDNITDIFASWQVPTETDNIHLRIKVCKGTNLLAPDGMSESLYEYKTITNVHSEKPDDPKWEGPVRAWAEANGMSGAAPKEYCDPNSMIVTNTINFVTPQDNAVISKDFNISVQATSPIKITSVAFYIDGIAIDTVSEPPYSTKYELLDKKGEIKLKTGYHTITAVLTDENNNTNKADIKIVIEDKSAKPLTISQVLASVTSPTTATISWKTNNSATSEVYYKLLTDSSFTKSSSQSDQTTNHEVNLTGLKPKSTYQFKVKSGTAESEINSFETN